MSVCSGAGEHAVQKNEETRNRPPEDRRQAGGLQLSPEGAEEAGENGIILSVCLGMFSMKALDGLRFDTAFAYGEDSLFLSFVLSRITKVWYDPVPLYHYLVSRDGNTYSELSLKKQESRIRSFEAIEAVWKGNDKVRPILEKILADLEIIAARLAHEAGDRVSFAAHRKAARIHAEAVQSSPAVSRKDKLRLKLAAASPVHGVDIYKRLKEGRG